jgi:hypothetical protein
MEESISFCKDFLEVELPGRLDIVLNGYPDTLALAHPYHIGSFKLFIPHPVLNRFGFSLSNVNSIGPSLFTHSLAVELLSRIGDRGSSSVFFEVGMAELLSVLFEQQYDGAIKYYSNMSAYSDFEEADDIMRLKEYNSEEYYVHVRGERQFNAIYEFTAKNILGRVLKDTYADAISFTHYLYSTYGKDRLLDAHRANFILIKVSEIYDKGISELAYEWLNHIWSYDIPEWWFG